MTIAVILLSVFALCVMAAALVDIVPAVRTWLSRIGIGSLAQDQAQSRMRAVALRWLRKMPAVPVSDQTRFTLPARLRGTYKNRTLQSWQQGALLLGVQQAGQTAAVQAAQQSILTPDGRWKQPVDRPDIALLAYALLCGAEDTQKVRPAMDAVYSFLKEQAGDGTVPYTPRAPALRFVDTVGMVCPFLSLYAQTYHVPQAAQIAVRQLEEYTRLGLHPATGLPAHAVRVPEGVPLGIYGWGRGCGWYALALSEMLRCSMDVLPAAQRFAKSILPLQQPDGAWSRQLYAETGVESTATAMLGHLMAVLYTQTHEEVYLTSARKAAQFLYTATRKNGEVDWAQGDTKGIGFYSARFTSAPAAQGFALLLTEELDA